MRPRSEVFKVVSLLETESKPVVAQHLGESEMRSCYTAGIEYQFSKIKFQRSVTQLFMYS